MTILKVLELLENENELRNALGIERAYMQISIDDIEANGIIRDRVDYNLHIKGLHKVDFVELLEQAEFKKTYGNTLTAYIDYQIYNYKHTYKVDLFIDC